MKEKTLLKVAMASSVLGLLVLSLLSGNLDVTETSISKIGPTNIGDDVKLIGKIDRITVLDKVAFIEIMKPETVSVVIFKDEDQDINLEKGNYVEIIGEVDEYNGEMQIIGNRVRVIP